MTHQEYQLTRIISKIPLFYGLTLEQMMTLLKLSRPVVYEENQRIYKLGDPGRDMLILLDGKLVATTESGEPLGEILPAAPAGELAVITDQPRSANITTAVKSKALVISRQALQILMDRDPDMHVRVLDNLVKVLSSRLRASNRLIDRQATAIHEMREKTREAACEPCVA